MKSVEMRTGFFSSLGKRAAAKIALIALALGVSALPASAHTYHTSLARMDYNAEAKAFEVTVQLFTHDLQPLLEKRLKKKVDLEKTPEIDAEIQKYLAANFVLQNKAGETSGLKWVGKEFEHDTIYLHLEIPFAGELAGARLQNTIFFESFPEQTNLVVIRFAQEKKDLLFKAGDKHKTL